MQIREVVAVGANPQQLRLDQREKLRSYATQLSKDDAAAFMRMYAEETTAGAGRSTDDAPSVAAPVVAAPSKARVVAALVLVVAVLVIVAMSRACA
ncbi:MAG: hypothetical protein JWL95_1839 [Gemmatimonadetes bacterium]|nr:hypothetical protein [Gemmatimonadota bacterium]